ncbi:MAG: type II toxin-antitoxin system PemK/MazF family toxin [Firmicutes bacterium]|nr:type II toxin-antitoxin system PemK/MazF family toxin [Bacillota bacterium]
MEIRRGDIFYADLNPVIGSEQGGVRPVLVVQNDIGNYYSPTTIVAAVTSKIKRAKLPTHVELPASTGHLAVDSVILLEQVRTIDKARLRERVGRLDHDIMRKVDRAAEISLGLVDL